MRLGEELPRHLQRKQSAHGCFRGAAQPSLAWPKLEICSWVAPNSLGSSTCPPRDKIAEISERRVCNLHALHHGGAGGVGQVVERIARLDRSVAGLLPPEHEVDPLVYSGRCNGT
jgi:hypothetical protein